MINTKNIYIALKVYLGKYYITLTVKRSLRYKLCLN